MTSHTLHTVGSSTAVRVSPSGTHSGVDITIQNSNDAGYIYVGKDTVSSTSYGFRLLPNHSISVELNGRDSLYVIGSTSNMKVAVLMTSLESGS